jgi:hypothetical protein
VYISTVIAGVKEDSYHTFEIPVTIRSASQKVPVSIMAVGEHGVGDAVPVTNLQDATNGVIPLQVKQK